MRTKVFMYWSTTVFLALIMLSGGIAELIQRTDNVQGMAILGYPPYFMYIIGLWKILGTIVILAPGFPRLKEWAYAGAFFNMTGAAASHFFANDYGPYAWHVIINLIFAGVVIASWVLRPSNRIPGTLFPTKRQTQQQ